MESVVVIFAPLPRIDPTERKQFFCRKQQPPVKQQFCRNDALVAVTSIANDSAVLRRNDSTPSIISKQPAAINSAADGTERTQTSASNVESC